MTSSWEELPLELVRFFFSVRVSLHNENHIEICYLKVSGSLSVACNATNVYSYSIILWTHCGLVMSYIDIDLGQYWIR